MCVHALYACAVCVRAMCMLCVCVLCVCVCYVYAVCGLCSTIKSGPIYTVGLSFLSQQIQPEIIDLCSSSSSCGEGDDLSFSPVKPKIKCDPSPKNPSEIIKQVIPNVDDDDYHDPATRCVPVLARPVQGLSVNQLFTLMVGTVPADRICHRKPTSVTYSSVFVVDLSCVRCIDDLRADDNGVWVHGGKPRRKYCVDVDPNTSEVINAVAFSGEPSSTEGKVFTLVRLYHHHKATPEFQRRIYYVIDSGGQTVQYAVVQYLFEDGNEVPVLVPPHGNSRKDSCSYRRTQKSTLSRLKELSGKPKSIVSTLHDEAGGSLGASSASELPRNRRQVYNSQQHSLPSTSKSIGKVDPIFELVQQCKVDLLPGGRRFIRSVNFDSSPCCVLATDGQLHNLVRFCTNPGASCVLGIDPTFNLGKFYVTVTTFTYSHVVNKTTKRSPTFFGPMFVHTEKNYESYYFFFSTLLKLEPKLDGIIAVGTDGEQAIVKALNAVFMGKPVHLRCFIHMKDNIRRKLTELLLPETIREEIIRDIFGTQQGTVYVMGILDALSPADFDDRLSSLKTKWDELEHSVHPHQEPQFYQWLLKNEVEDMKVSMIASVRESAGLGSPPVAYTTNRNESMNKVAKSYADYRQSSWVQLANNMFDLVNAQTKVVEKAVYGMGEYKFKPTYKRLDVGSSKWFVMSCEQRQKHLRKVFGMHCIPVETDTVASAEGGIPPGEVVKRLSIPPERSGITTISPELLERTWRKAEKLLTTTGSICMAPGMSDAMCVASETGSKPHIVSTTKSGSVACDEACMAWKSQKFCSHVLAVAEKRDCLDEFLASYRRSKVSGNYTAVCTHNQPKGVGKKPGNPKRKGPSDCKKPEVESYVDPLSRNTLQTSLASQIPVLSHCVSQPVSVHNVTNPQAVRQSPLLMSQSSPFVSTGQISNLNYQCSPLQILPSQLPSQLTSPPPTVTSNQPFQLKFLTPQIKVCAGCRDGYARVTDGKSCLPPPHDLCLVHKEQHLYYNVVNGRQQFSSLSNVHYHANPNCPRARFPNFNPLHVQIPEEIKEKLLPTHWLFFFETFGSV